MKLGFALLPNRRFIESIVAFQKTCLNYVALQPMLGTQRNLPHVSLLHAEFSDSVNLVSILETLRLSLRITFGKKIFIKLTEVEYFEIGWFFIMISRDNWLQDLHQLAFDLSKDFIISPKAPLKNKISHYSLNEMNNYLKYGYRFIGEYYKPHITLGRIKHDYSDKAAYLIKNLFKRDITKTTQSIDYISLFEIGENGSYKRTVQSFPVKNNF